MSTQMKETFTTVAVSKIASESNRKHGGMGNIEILAESIKTDGLINPPTVIGNADGTYRIIAGRRRIEAVRHLKWSEIPVRVIDEADPDHLEYIGLAENVNRQEMNPLDEAETFRRLLEKGTAIEDIAAYYDRTVAGINHRIRLCGLIDGIRDMFRDGKINLSGAALVASLSPEEQEGFHKKFGDKGAGKWDITGFLHKAQRFPLTSIADERCETCQKRTHNTTPGLFEEYSGLNDVCLDEDCYNAKWREKITGLINAAAEKAGETDDNIILDTSIPRFLPKKTDTVMLDREFNMVPHGKYVFERRYTKKSKKDTAWLVSMNMDNEVKAERVKYEKYEPVSYGSAHRDPVEEFSIDQLPEIKKEDRETVAAKVKEKYLGSWGLKQTVKVALLKTVIKKRLNDENRENLATLYLADMYSDEDGVEGKFDRNHEAIFTALFNPEQITMLEELTDKPPFADPLIQKMFFFLIATDLKIGNLPDLDDSDDEWEGNKKSLFWKFARMEKDEYIALYKKILYETVMAAGHETEQEPEGE